MTSSSSRIQAVTVNHNTSHFAELMLRTLALTNDLRGIDFRVTVLDNGSDDEHLGALRSYLAEQKIPLVPTGFDNSVAAEKHGVALGAFVREHPECTHYLFLDSDMWFVEEDTISTMLRELLESADPVFANQARIYGYYAYQIIEGRDGAPGASSVDGLSWPSSYAGQSYATSAAPRCSPVCSLIANTPIFRQVVQQVGLSRGVSFGVGTATYYDTFGLMTRAMATHGLRFIVSSKRVNHFTETAYRSELRAPKDRDCLRMLRELRAGRGMEMELFRQSDWKKQS